MRVVVGEGPREREGRDLGRKGGGGKVEEEEGRRGVDGRNSGTDSCIFPWLESING